MILFYSMLYPFSLLYHIYTNNNNSYFKKRTRFKMVFSGLTFIYCFLPVTLLAYFIVPEKYKNIILTISSMFFYAWGEPVYVLIMFFSISFNFSSGLLLEKLKRRKLVLALSVIVNILVLCMFKYTDFIINNINTVFNLNIAPLELPLPIGISFYTFQTMSYVIDVYRHEVPATKSIVDFSAYVSLFPQLIAGPIVRYSTVHEQLKKRSITINKIADGGYRFFCGLAKKVLLANNIGMLWDSISTTQNLQWQSAWLGIIAFTLQIYFDFSGYSDMAIGLGKMLGFDFLENFNYPYTAKSVTDFWRKWHISLSSWFKDYVYIPLGGNRVKLLRNCINILVVWALTGLWHGASWNFIVWGLYYGILLIVEKNIFKKTPAVICRIYTLTAVIIGWVFFSAESFTSAFRYIITMFSFNTMQDKLFLYNLTSYLPMLIIMVAGCTPIPKKLTDKAPVLKPIFAIGSLLLCTAYLIDSTYNPFLYFRF